MFNSVLDSIIKEYYKPILKYCNKYLHNNFYAAEDCTQEVFLILHQKINKLDMTRDIRPWLYRTADRVMKAYLRKHPETENLDNIPEIAEEPVSHESVLDILTDEERQLVELYYNHVDKRLLAEKLGITLQSLYLKMARIKQKLKHELDHSSD